MEDETFQKITIFGIIILIVGAYLIFQTMIKLGNSVNNYNDPDCNALIDDIYTRCRVNSETKIETLDGDLFTLTYENGVCIIK